MAIERHHWRQIVACNVTGRALSAGYPDLLVDQKDIPVAQAFKVVRPDSDAVCKHHSVTGPVLDTGVVFQGMGLSLDVIDREKLQGCERVVDLNEPQELGEYDLVIDPGTSEHCFNIAQAAKNLAGAVKVGGYISQAIPMSMFNHGYYNVNPVWFLDFYEANGFHIEQIYCRDRDNIINAKPDRSRYMGVPDGAVTICTARRVAVQPFVWPQQSLPK